ncbi:MAG: hypothetical protein ACK56F_28055, partial [bacterium]
AKEPVDDKRNITTDPTEEAEVEGSEKFDISRGHEAVQAAGKGNFEENTKCETKNGKGPGLQ